MHAQTAQLQAAPTPLIDRALKYLSLALVVAVVGFAAQRTLANVIAGIQIAVSQPIRIGDRLTFDECEGRVTDITLSYTYLDPGDGSSVVIPNQLLTEGVVHNHSTEDTVA